MHLLKINLKDSAPLQELYINPEAVCLMSRTLVKDKEVFALVLSSGVQLIVEEETFLGLKDFAKPVEKPLPYAFLNAWDLKDEDDD